MNHSLLNLTFVLLLCGVNALLPRAVAANPAIVFAKPDPPRVPDPPPTGSGVKRQPCQNLTVPASAIALSAGFGQNNELLPWGKTVREEPEFWFYIPYSLKQIEEVRFKLLDSDGSERYERVINPSPLPGIIRIPSPQPLESDRWYQALLEIDVYCTETTPVGTESLRSNVFKMDAPASLVAALAAASTPLEKAGIYARYGLWYDVLSEIARSPEAEFRRQREQLFDSVELTLFKTLPVTQCCISD